MLAEKVKAVEPKIIEYRRWFHEHPELSGEECETLKFIKKELDQLGIRYEQIENGGLFGYLGDPSKGPTILLRGDMDALPIEENPCNLTCDKVVVSKNPGVSHACGHDGHTAMLLGAAQVLSELEDELMGRVILCFEQGEEGLHLAQNIISYVQKNKIEIDFCYGMHLRHCLESGKMSANAGAVMAGIYLFDITLVGQGGHGSRPDLSISPIDCFAKIHAQLNEIRVKRLSPFDQLTFSIGKLEAGSKGNVIPSELTFAGSFRYFDREVAKKYHEAMIEAIETTAKASRIQVRYNQFAGDVPSLINDELMSQFVRDTIVKYQGEKTLVVDEPWMGSETFALYGTLAPSVFAFLGIANPKLGTGANHHTPEFDVDEAVLYKGTLAHVSVAVEFLNGKQVK